MGVRWALGWALRAALAAGAAALGGCAGDLSDIDRRVDRVLARRSEAVDGGSVVPHRASEAPDLPRLRDLASKEPTTINPPASGLAFKPADEKRDFAKRLSDLQHETAGQGEGAARGRVVELDLGGAWRQGQQTAREYLNAEEEYILAGIRLLIEEHRWDWRLFANSSVTFTGEQNNGNVGSVLGIMNQAGVRKQLPFGGEVAARWVWNATEDLRSRVNGQYRQSSELVLEGNVPLLKGAGLVAQESRIQAQRDLVYAARDFETFRRQFLVNIAADFFALLQQQDNLESTRKQVESLRHIREQQQALYEAGRVAKFQVNNASSDVLNAEAGLANAEESLLLALDRFRVRLGLPEGTHVRVLPSQLMVPEPDVSLDDAVAEALDFRLDLQNRRDRLDDTKRGVKIAQNQLLPDLNLSGNVSLPTDPGAREGGAVYELDDTKYSAALRLDLPVDKESERLALRSAIIGLQQAQRTFDQFRDELIIDVRARVREIERARFNLRLAEDRVVINERRQEEQEIKADEVDTQSRLDTENALLDSRRARNQAQADVRNAVLQYLLATGTLRVKRDGTFEPLPGMAAGRPPEVPGDAPMQLPSPEEPGR